MRATPTLKRLLELEAARRDCTISDTIRRIINLWVRERELELNAAERQEQKASARRARYRAPRSPKELEA